MGKHPLDSSSTSLSCVRTDSGQADCLAFVVLGTVLLSTTLRIHGDRSGHIMTVRFLSILATLLSSSPLLLCNGLPLGLKFGHKFGHMLAGPLWFKGTLFLRGILNNCLGLVIAFLSSLLEATASWSTDLPGFLGTTSDGCVFLDSLLLNTANLLGPF